MVAKRISRIVRFTPLRHLRASIHGIIGYKVTAATGVQTSVGFKAIPHLENKEC
jgi:hypothetical protein